MALRNKLTVTVSEAAALLGISRALAYELVAREEIPAIRLGYRIVVPTHRLLDLVFNERTRPIAMTNGARKAGQMAPAEVPDLPVHKAGKRSLL
jgi:excisionase family DNA binding protein